jgi:hypothetical protein
MKTACWIGLFVLASQTLLSQTSAPVSTDPARPITTKSTATPKYLLYRHFLAMVDNLDNKAIAAGETDPYKFAQPFANARLENSDLEVVRREAKALTKDLAEHDRKLKAAVAIFRQRVQAELQEGKPLPAVPTEIHELQALRTALMVHHMVSLQAQLGPQKTDQLEGYMTHEFAPHVSLQAVTHPPANVTAAAQTRSFGSSPQ